MIGGHCLQESALLLYQLSGHIDKTFWTNIRSLEANLVLALMTERIYLLRSKHSMGVVSVASFYRLLLLVEAILAWNAPQPCS